MRENFKKNQGEIPFTLTQEDRLYQLRYHFIRAMEDHHIWIDRVWDRLVLLALHKVQQ